MQALLYTLAPVLAVVLGAIIASRTKLKPNLARLIHEPAALGRAGFDVSVAA
jgi:ZIP family zinc transporter